MKLNVIKNSKIWLGSSLAVVLLSILAVIVFGFNWSIEFTGGSLFEFETVDSHESSEIRETVLAQGIEASVQSAGENQYIVRMPEITSDQKDALVEALTAKFGKIEEQSYDSIGPTIGAELKRKAVTAVIILLVLIASYVAWAFRKVSGSVESWKYGILTIVAAAHDVIIPAGVFAVLGKYAGYQIDVAFIAAILTILGYSINDTIVVFDRTRENLLRQRRVSHDEFASIVDTSVNQTAVRSVNTSLTTLLAMAAVFFFGGETLKPFALALMIGILSGTYSSIFVASPLLVWWQGKK
jgi:preprotein translocase subunit SecF